MALPHLVKYVYTHGTDEVIRRGKKIHAVSGVELVEYDDLFGSAVFRVKDDTTLLITKYIFKNLKTLSLFHYVVPVRTTSVISAGMKRRLCFSCRK